MKSFRFRGSDMIILIGGEKGGSGKTTLACNLAVWGAQNGLDLLLIDGDPQASASRFFERRDESFEGSVTCVRKVGDLYATVQAMSGRFDAVIIDTGGRDSIELRTAMAAADVLVVPTQPSQLDLETLIYLDKVIGTAKSLNPGLSAHCIISRAPNYPNSIEAQSAKIFINALENLSLSRQAIKDRKIYRDCFILGHGVTESKNPQARGEIQLLAQEIFIDSQTCV
ncbi:AAA family ATPase [Pseudomonas putida]|uniref:AAA family ATPase n=2 Tax=Pseudomonas putida TaxID=303 RepID=UPI001E2ABE7E|nr:AAA family ATPase [Pseudomonas putida]MCE0882915.1 AAA family ATPase [Pseudomonas putida]